MHLAYLAILLALTVVPSLAKLHRDQITNLLTFGDSYTDVVYVWDGGVAWPTYAVRYASEGRGGGRTRHARSPVTLYPFARAGAVCSTKITTSLYSPVMEGQLPAYYSSVANGTIPSALHNPSNLALDNNAKVTPHNTLYTLWIGTNDIGAWGLLQGHGIGGATVVDTVQCAVDWVKRMYEGGARNFLWQNMIPLELTPMYSANAYPNKFTTAAKNATEWHIMMKELTTAGNKIGELLLRDLAPKLEGAHIGLFDSHALFTDMYANPGAYLNGTAPLNVTGSAYTCVYKEWTDVRDKPPCTKVNGTDRDSYLWWDELHPGEQADRVVAQQISQVMLGEENKWTTWLS
ncbi:GDSL lipase/esterase [Schizophyllum commune]